MPNPPPRLRYVMGPRAGSRPARTRSTVRVGLAEDLGVQVLRAGEDVEAEDVDVGGTQLAEHAGTFSASTPNCCGPPPICMPDPLTRKSGLTRSATRGRSPSRSPSRRRAAPRSRFQLDGHAGGDGLRQLGVGLARPGEADPRPRGRRVEGRAHLESRRDVEGVDEADRCWTTAGIGFAFTA